MNAKQHSRFVTARMRANVLANAKKTDWVRRRQQEAIRSADRAAAMSDEDLWNMVPSQDVPRAIYSTKGVLYDGVRPHCPNCGEEAPMKFRTRTWWDRVENSPWKLRCRNCREIHPKNDFEAFCRSGFDEHRMFRRDQADQSLLFNSEHPDPDDPLHKLYVDDGLGMTDEKGQVHHMVAYYAHHYLWMRINRYLKALVEAYAVTSERLYAHKAAVLLDRIADVYPEMDYKPYFRIGMQHSHGGTGEGRIQGCISECGGGTDLARGYDTIFDGVQGDVGLVDFCSSMATRYRLGDKNSVAEICRHIERNLLLEILASTKDGRIRANTGSTQTCLATAAIALDDPTLTPQWLDWLFDPNFPSEQSSVKDPINWVLVEGLDRDGMGGENGYYGLGWARGMQLVAEILAAYPEYTKHNLVRDYPKLKQSFFIASRLNILDAMMPNAGDSGEVGSWARFGSASVYMLGYRLYRDPRFADLAWREHELHGASLRRGDDIYRQNPDALIEAVQRTARLEESALQSDHMGRYGQARLQTASRANGRAVFIHYGQGKGHSHHDCLNIGILAKNVAMIPDFGYPEYTGNWPKRGAWTANTISHNTLQIGDRRSGNSPGGKIRLFTSKAPLRVIQVDAPNAYEGVETYLRTVALVDVGDDDSYVLDVFRARGGRNHRLSWHGSAKTAQANGLTLVKQATGTFAGPGVPFAKLDGPDRASYMQSGFTYLYDVERSAGGVTAPYSIDWEIVDTRGRVEQGKKPRLRLHALTPCDEVSLATGDSPNRTLRPRYVIQSRLGENMQSQFVNVLEPYERTPIIRQVRCLQVEHGADVCGVAAVAVELADGRTDILVSCEQRTAVKVEGGVDFDGMFGMVRIDRGRPVLMRLVGGTLLAYGDVKLTTGRGAYSGTVVRPDASEAENNRVCLEPPLPANAGLEGLTIHFINDLPMDTSYKIRAVTADGISTGDTTVVRGFKDRTDFAAGYTYLVNPGDGYVLPVTVALDRDHGR